MSIVENHSTVRTEIAGIPISQLAEQFGTPTYIYDADSFRQRIGDLRAFDVIRYAQKACSNLAILDLVRREGVLVDAVSAGEVHRALAAGYTPHGDPHPIVYTADIFDRDALALCAEKQIHINAGSEDMISQWGRVAPGSQVTLRMNPGFGHGHSQKTNTGGEHSKHGIWHDHVSDCVEAAGKYELSISGVHVHIGSGTDLQHLGQVCDAVEKIAREIGPSITTISVGGGLPIRYRPEEELVDIDQYYIRCDAMRNRLSETFGHHVRLEIEPGRYLSAESGFLLAEIRAIKKMGSNLFYLLDAGFNNLARPILYGAFHPMSVCHRVPQDRQTSMLDVVVGGPLCESGDIFTQKEGGFVCSRTLPQADVGDYLIIECAGAYGFVMSSNYNSRPMAAEALVDNGEVRLIRRRQTVDDLLSCEMVS